MLRLAWYIPSLVVVKQRGLSPLSYSISSYFQDLAGSDDFLQSLLSTAPFQEIVQNKTPKTLSHFFDLNIYSKPHQYTPD